MAKKGRPPKAAWVTTTELLTDLAISRSHLKRLMASNFFKEGYHYRNIALAHSARPSYKWHLDRCEKLFNTPQEYRG